MTNADGSHYTLKQLNEMSQAEFETSTKATKFGSARRCGNGDSIPRLDADPWAEPLQGGAQIAVESLGAAIADLSKMTHELFDRIEPCLADPGDRPAEGGLLPPTAADSASPLRKSIVELEHKVRDLHYDVMYVLRRVEL
ncbi:hypothetical protein E4P29_18645 [Rhodococcus sp. 1R11]|uniref:hypothetical protein n=1 Tax=Rhodococcus sp. 1R11 TaxID=2559614 RepID=UPI0010727D8C|nr:hypothetical protein [Rhodococcus sp. 1R11]TFI42069.1 hypothetical protein E4P29_18645 [Rhodococcus sp. 1R11]